MGSAPPSSRSVVIATTPAQEEHQHDDDQKERHDVSPLRLCTRPRIGPSSYRSKPLSCHFGFDRRLMSRLVSAICGTPIRALDGSGVTLAGGWNPRSSLGGRKSNLGRCHNDAAGMTGDNTSPLRLLVTGVLKASVSAVVVQAAWCVAVIRWFPPRGPDALFGALLLSLAIGYAVTWKEWRKYPLLFTLLWWGLMWFVLFFEALELLYIGDHRSF